MRPDQNRDGGVYHQDDFGQHRSLMQGFGGEVCQKSSRVLYAMTTPQPLIEWTLGLSEPGRPAMMAVPEPIPTSYQFGEWRRFQPSILIDAAKPCSVQWVNEGVIPNIMSRLAGMTVPEESRKILPGWFPPSPGIWELLWALVSIDSFVVFEPLRSKIDRSMYVIHDVFRAVWEAHFLVRENPSLDAAEAFVETLVRWISGEKLLARDKRALQSIQIEREISKEDQAEVICFLTTLAAHNGIVSGIIIGIEDLGKALEPGKRPVLRQLHSFIAAVERWVPLGCPIGILLGFTGEERDIKALRFLDEKFAEIVEGQMEWARVGA